MRRLLLLLLALTFLSCSRQSDQEKLEKSLHSWQQSLEFAHTAWNQKQVPDHYMREVAEAAAKELETNLAGDDIPPSLAARCRKTIDQAKQLAAAASRKPK